MDVQAAVTHFHETFKQPIRTLPKFPSETEMKFRAKFTVEESSETVDAMMLGDLAGVADGLADMVYVAYGTALYFGIDLNAVIQEVHDANMRKLDDSGRPLIREDGKVLKPTGWQGPDIELVLERQRDAHKAGKRAEARERVYAGIGTNAPGYSGEAVTATHADGDELHAGPIGVFPNMDISLSLHGKWSAQMGELATHAETRGDALRDLATLLDLEDSILPGRDYASEHHSVCVGMSVADDTDPEG